MRSTVLKFMLIADKIVFKRNLPDRSELQDGIKTNEPFVKQAVVPCQYMPELVSVRFCFKKVLKFDLNGARIRIQI